MNYVSGELSGFERFGSETSSVSGELFGFDISLDWLCTSGELSRLRYYSRLTLLSILIRKDFISFATVSGHFSEVVSRLLNSSNIAAFRSNVMEMRASRLLNHSPSFLIHNMVLSSVASLHCPSRSNPTVFEAARTNSTCLLIMNRSSNVVSRVFKEHLAKNAGN